MSYMKSVGTSAKGNDRLLKQYGGNSGSSPMARQHYATGGAVKKDGNPSLDEGLASAADGAPSKPSLSRPGRKMPGKGGKDAKKGTNVNVVIMQSPAKGGPDAGPGGPPPMPMPPPGAGPGGPPMPMRKYGGSVGKFATGGRISNLGKYAHGGKVQRKADGGEAVEKRVRGPGELDESAQRDYVKAKAEGARQTLKSEEGAGGGTLLTGLGVAGALAARTKIGRALGAAAGATGIVAGSKGIKRELDAARDAKKYGSEAKEFDKADMAERKSGGRLCRKEGGPAIGLHEDGKTVGSGGGLGRLAKARMYGK